MMELTFPNKILLGLQEGTCNLQCPKCFTHGENSPSDDTRKKGVMNFEKFKTLLDQIVKINPKARVTAQTWDEPFLTPDILKYLEEIKKRGLFCSVDTNGILLNEETSLKLIELKVDSVFISLDAFSDSKYIEIRGVDKLNLIKNNIYQLLKLRSNHSFPRIGVSFVEEENNKNELNNFIDFWSLQVDCIRVNEIYNQDRSIKTKNHERYPCWSLSDSMMISFDGSVGLCCVDTHYETQAGNVFETPIDQIWEKGFFKEARIFHENKNFSKINICKTCDLWKNDDIINTETETLKIAKSSTHTYYNNKNRLHNLTDNRYLK